MSRRLQMLVEEGAHSSYAHAVRTVGSQNRPRFHQKTEKTADSVDGIIKKRKKLRIPWAESSKNGKNCGFRGQNHQKNGKNRVSATAER